MYRSEDSFWEFSSTLLRQDLSFLLCYVLSADWLFSFQAILLSLLPFLTDRVGPKWCFFFFFFEPLESLLSSAFPSPSQKSLCLDPTSHCSIDSLRSGKDLWGPAGMLSWTFRLQNKLWDVWVWSSSSHSLKGKTDITTCP